MSVISYKNLKTWYLVNKRNLPWRHTTDPYLVWLSEIILQQTKVDQGLSYFNRISAKFPNVESLANAEENELLLMWQGLGYYSRALNLHKTAKIVAQELNGIFPENYEGLLKLPGVGSYTAAAIASFCYLEKIPVLDGNVYRVLSRVYGIEEPINTGISKKVFMERLTELIPKQEPDIFNQAMMEFGALQCTPKKPNCSSCPFVGSCVAYNTSTIKHFPVKKKSKEKRIEYRYSFVLSKGDEIALIQRDNKSIWKNLFELPSLVKQQETDESILSEELRDWFNNQSINIKNAPIYHTTHVLSHIKMEVDFYEIPLTNKIEFSGLLWVKRTDIDGYAVHQLMRKFFDQWEKLHAKN